MMEVSEFDDCARRLKALAEPERLRIVNCLFAGARNVGDLAAALDDDIVKVSHHLGVLRNAGLVQAEKQGRFVVYALHPDVVAAARLVGDQRQIDLGCCRLDLSGTEPAADPLKRRGNDR